MLSEQTVQHLPECEKEKLVREYYGLKEFNENIKSDLGNIVQCLYDYEEKFLKQKIEEIEGMREAIKLLRKALQAALCYWQPLSICEMLSEREHELYTDGIHALESTKQYAK